MSVLFLVKWGIVAPKVFLGCVQTWCRGSALGHGHQCEHSILEVPVQKNEHGTRVRALVCARFHQCHVFYPCFPVIWSCGGDKMATLQQIETKLRAPQCLNVIPFSARAQCPGTGTKSGHGLSSSNKYHVMYSLCIMWRAFLHSRACNSCWQGL